jgi:Domain of unknown function (DUF5658)
MSRRLVVAAAVVLSSFSSWAVRAAVAQNLVPDAHSALDSATVPVPLQPPVLAAAVTAEDHAQLPLPTDFAVPRTTGSHVSFMAPLYASTAALQILDVHSTLAGLSQGAREGNTLMSGVVSNRGAFVAAKIGVAAGTIWAASRIAKHNKLAAVATLIAIDSAYAFVVAHNYRIAHGGR